ncbi:MAG: hypothetical protein ACI9WH_001103, partial [Glaciecola sp.]
APIVPFLSFENAVNILLEKGEVTEAERVILLEYNEKRKLSVRVDEFTFDMEIIPAVVKDDFTQGGRQDTQADTKANAA